MQKGKCDGGMVQKRTFSLSLGSFFHISTVFLDRDVEGTKLPTVRSDNVAAAYEATSHLLEQGYRRIGAIVGRAALDSMTKRVKGYRKALAEHRIKFDPTLVVDSGDVGVSGGYQAAIKLLDRKRRPTALLAMNNLLVMGALNAVSERGIKIPNEMALVGWDDFYAAPHLATPLTMIDQPAHSMGVIAAEQLLKMLANEPLNSTLNVVLKSELIIRGSSIRGEGL
jgi:DNA-binding LacI/PurR family transcriptional regulator